MRPNSRRRNAGRGLPYAKKAPPKGGAEALGGVHRRQGGAGREGELSAVPEAEVPQRAEMGEGGAETTVSEAAVETRVMAEAAVKETRMMTEATVKETRVMAETVRAVELLAEEYVMRRLVVNAVAMAMAAAVGEGGRRQAGDEGGHGGDHSELSHDVLRGRSVRLLICIITCIS